MSLFANMTNLLASVFYAVWIFFKSSSRLFGVGLLCSLEPMWAFHRLLNLFVVSKVGTVTRITTLLVTKQLGGQSVKVFLLEGSCQLR